MAEPTALEQYLIELINYARLDPAAEARRLGIDLNQGLAAGTITGAAKQPLAVNPHLVEAARDHSQWMLDHDTFSHSGLDGSTPGARMADAGYAFTGSWTWGENIAWRGSTGALTDLTPVLAQEHDGLFKSPEHRVNILNDAFREVGTGTADGTFSVNGTSYNSLLVTEDFGKSGTAHFITGVAYDDRNGNSFYTPGEGHGGVHVEAKPAGRSAAAAAGTTGTAGGYALAAPSGSYDVTFSGGDLPASITGTVSLGTKNVKLDLVNHDTLASSASLTMGDGLHNLTLLGNEALTATGNGLDNKIIGNAGNDVLIGGAGGDILTGGAGADRFVFTKLADSGDTVTDFNRGAGDRLDLSALFDSIGYNGTDPIADHHLRTVQVGPDVRVDVDPDGSGTFTGLVKLLGVSTTGLGTDYLIA